MSYGHTGPDTNSHQAVTLRPDLAAMLIDLCGNGVGCDWFMYILQLLKEDITTVLSCITYTHTYFILKRDQHLPIKLVYRSVTKLKTSLETM